MGSPRRHFFLRTLPMTKGLSIAVRHHLEKCRSAFGRAPSPGQPVVEEPENGVAMVEGERVHGIGLDLKALDKVFIPCYYGTIISGG